jgi:hypothetical protein
MRRLASLTSCAAVPGNGCTVGPRYTVPWAGFW